MQLKDIPARLRPLPCRVKNKRLPDLARRLVPMLLAALIVVLPVFISHYRAQAAEAVQAGVLRDAAAELSREVAALSAENAALAGEVEELTPKVETPLPEREPPEGALSAPEILADASVIEHALGTVDGVAMLNSYESFLTSYEAGVRVFEADFRLTSDDAVVLRHDWRAYWQEDVSELSIPTLEEFRAKPVLEKYTPLTFRDMLLLMEDYPDICIVTDSKYTDAEIITREFEAIVEDARMLGRTYLFDRIAVQVYSPLMYKVIDNIYHFPHYIYTLYMQDFQQTDEDFRARSEYCVERGILGLTMWHFWWRDSFAPIAEEYGLFVFVHTVNDAEYARDLLSRGVDAVYTDELVPADLFPDVS